MKKAIYPLIALLILAVLALSLHRSGQQHQQAQNEQLGHVPQYIAETTELIYGEHTLTLEVADTPAERSHGLMYRTKLPRNTGMLFVFAHPDRYAFWMKNTLISLDLIRLDTNYRVVDIISTDPCNTDPCPTFQPQQAASYVIELAQGTAERIGLVIGEQLMRAVNETEQ